MKKRYTSKEYEKIKKEVAVRAWTDPKFKEKLLKDPKGALKEMGVEVPENIEFRVVEDTMTKRTFVLPLPGSMSEELPAEVLEKLVGGSGCPQVPTYN